MHNFPTHSCTVPPMKIRKVKSVFTRPETEGDFAWMIEQPKYAQSLFIFNDNETQFKAFHAKDPNGLSAGGGNAIIRPYQAGAHPRAAGIPTGDGTGYLVLDSHVKGVINQAINYIKKLLASGNYNEIVFCTDQAGETLGAGIYSIACEVKDYIFRELMEI